MTLDALNLRISPNTMKYDVMNFTPPRTHTHAQKKTQQKRPKRLSIVRRACDKDREKERKHTHLINDLVFINDNFKFTIKKTVFLAYNSFVFDSQIFHTQ